MAEPLLISDGRAMGLVDDRARLSWLVAPRIDQPSIVSGLIDPEHGGGIELVFPDSEPVAHRHREGTLIVETDLEGPTGAVRVIDALAIPPRGPVQAAWPGMFVRQVLVLKGEVEIGLVTRLRYAYGRNPPRWRGEGRKIIGYGPGLTIELQSEIPPRAYGVDLGGTTTLPEGERRVMALRWQDPQAKGTDLRATVEDTARFWRAWGTDCDHDPNAVLLKGMMYHPTGAMLRAATTSYGDGPLADGRLAWMEDQPRAAAAFRALGYEGEAAYIKQWIERAGDGGPIRDVSGGEPPAEAKVDDVDADIMIGAPPGDAQGNIPYLPYLLDQMGA
ncbi:MAG: trehalase-like domain-containing protein [Thermoleophilia bacterium]